MGWSGRAPAPSAMEAGKGRQRRGARHVPADQCPSCRCWRRHRQKLLPRCRSGRTRADCVAAKMVTSLGRGPVCQYAILSDRLGGLRRGHHLSRRLKALGHDARLMPARYVRPYSRGQKNDFRDAEAIAEAVQRPTMKFVVTKTADQLDLQALRRVRERLVSQRTAIINQIRAFLLERGIAVRQGQHSLRAELPHILATPSDTLSPRMQRVIEALASDLRLVLHLDQSKDLLLA